MNISFYMLTPDGAVTTTDDQMVWAGWFSKIENRRVAVTVVEGKGLICTDFISTIAGDNLYFGPEWETEFTPLIGEAEYWRWFSLAEAQAGHELILDYVREKK